MADVILELPLDVLREALTGDPCDPTGFGLGSLSTHRANVCFEPFGERREAFEPHRTYAELCVVGVGRSGDPGNLPGASIQTLLGVYADRGELGGARRRGAKPLAGTPRPRHLVDATDQG